MNTCERNCFECGHPGHIRSSCPQLFGSGRGRGQNWRGRGRGRGLGGRGIGRGRAAGRANASVMVDEHSQNVNVEMSADDWEKWQQFKGLRLGGKQTTEAPTTPSFATSANFSGNIPNAHTSNFRDAPWLIDSGASRHMAGSHKKFTNYARELRGQSVKLVDGSTQTIMGSGTLVCNSNMPLSSVLHVPSFPINLLSISCITSELNCVLIFLPSWCLNKELGT